jgi:type II secretory pathway component GspD/PulD (secretin)
MQNSTTTMVHKSTFREAASVIANRETGVVTVRATGRQHEKVREFIDEVMVAARRQVLIEATILEVGLSDTYRQGIEWQRILESGTRFGITGPDSAPAPATPSRPSASPTAAPAASTRRSGSSRVSAR